MSNDDPSKPPRLLSSLRESRHSTKLILCLGTVYLVWGSAFIFTKIAVQNLPPALFAGIRFVTAGVLLAIIARTYGRSHLPTRLVEWRHVIVAGFFMVFVSNGLNTWAIQFLPSNESALLNGTSAFWIAGLGVFGRRGHPLTRWAILGLAVGFIGAAESKEALIESGLPAIVMRGRKGGSAMAAAAVNALASDVE